MTTLITGSAGHLGEALMRTYADAGQPARGIDILPSAFTTAVGSIADRDFVARQMRGVEVVMHTATLHKPHVATHSKQAFIDTNVTGTQVLLDAAVSAGVRAFVFTSTTSTFGDAMRPPKGAPAVWVTEDLAPVVKSIYGATKVAAEDLCALAWRDHRLPCIVLRTSRFFPEGDDNATVREHFDDANTKVNEFCYRRVDISDAVDAHLLAADRASAPGFARYIISAPPPFRREDVAELGRNASAVLIARVPSAGDLYAERGWQMFTSLGRVYDSAAAQAELGWQPRYTFAHVIDELTAGRDFLSPLARLVGSKGYHG